MIAKKVKSMIMFICVLGALTASATEYFVSKKGNDQNDGESEEKAFSTIKKGVSVLSPGDILTICPGEYFESVVCPLNGEKDAPIVIRAKHPRSAILRGDVPLTAEFQKVPELQFTYVCDEAREVWGVLDRGFLIHYKPACSIEAVDRYPGRYFHDTANKKLYIHSCDSLDPSKHNLTLAGALGKHGLYIKNTNKNPHDGSPDEKDWARHIIIEGLSASGFVRSLKNKTSRKGIGIGVFLPKNCVIRDCVSFLNCAGIEFTGPRTSRDEETALNMEASENCVVERCVVYACDDGGDDFGAGVICRGPIKSSSIRDCVGFKSYQCLRFYTGVVDNCEIKNNITFNSGDIWEKANFHPGKNIISGNVCEKLVVHNKKSVLTRNLTGSLVFPTYGPNPDPAALNENNIIMDRTGAVNFDANFAAPARLDYRLQSDSVFRGTGRAPIPYEDVVFYVKPDGDDNAAGTSVKQAWKTLNKACQSAKPGHTVYILAGVYNEKLVPANSGAAEKPIVFSKRGHARVVVKGIELKDKSYVTVKGLSVLKGEGPGINIGNGENLNFEQCVVADRTGSAVLARNVNGLKISHSTLTGNNAGLDLIKCQNPIVSANIFNANSRAALKLDKDSLETLYSDYNSFSDSAKCAVISDETSTNNYDLKTWRELTGLDEYSLTRVPEFDSEFHLRNSYLFNGYGPVAMPIGPYERIKKAAGGVIKLQTRSLTATTANIECQTPGALSNCELRWGANPECQNREGLSISYLLPHTKSVFHYFSLTGLTSGQKYFYKIIATIPTYSVFTNEAIDPKLNDKKTVESETLSFTTPTEEQAPVTYHVSPSGDDKNNGQTWEESLRTISAAAAKVKAGDTVIVDDGEYKEDVIVRGTGDKDRPVTIKARNPGEVFLNGEGRIKSAFELLYKHWIVIDGFYIRNYARKTDDLSGSFSIIRGSNNSARRSIFDGRSSCPMQMFVCKSTSDATIENCVFRNAWLEIVCYGCPNFTIKNNVFYGNMCGCIAVHNAEHQKVTLSHNIIGAQVPKKRKTHLLRTTYLGAVIDECNCYFTRLPENEKRLYSIKKPREVLTFAELKKRPGKGEGSFFANPGMPIIKEYETFKGDLTGRPHKFVTQELNWKVVSENGKKKRVPEIALYDQFFASNPKCVKAEDGQIIGLDPEKFKDIK